MNKPFSVTARAWKDAGTDSELDYIGQTSWVLFLRYLEYLEPKRQDEAELRGEIYQPILSEKYRWRTWAMPKDEEGKLDSQPSVEAA